jgi:hypothetical protein
MLEPSVRRESVETLSEGRLLILLDLAKDLSASKPKDLALRNQQIEAAALHRLLREASWRAQQPRTRARQQLTK